jgi:hypothetical protein
MYRISLVLKTEGKCTIIFISKTKLHDGVGVALDTGNIKDIIVDSEISRNAKRSSLLKESGEVKENWRSSRPKDIADVVQLDVSIGSNVNNVLVYGKTSREKANVFNAGIPVSIREG